MKEQDFKETFVEGFMAAYEVATKYGISAGRTVMHDDIVRVANQKASDAWDNYCRKNQ